MINKPLISSPHFNMGGHSQQLMLWLCLACMPGLLAQTYWFGYGVLFNIVASLVVGIALEVWVLHLRRQPIRAGIFDGSALVTCVLLGLSLPPFAPWWLVMLATMFAILFAKQLFGGLGSNPFNPAMIGYAICLIAFPATMSLWANPEQSMSFAQQWAWFWTEQSSIDGYTQATPLDVYKHLYGKTISEVTQTNPVVLNYAMANYWISGCYALGGILLLAVKVYTWHAPVSMLTSISVLSGLFSAGEPDLMLGILGHLAFGATMLGAFFIITDPVSSATSRLGRLYFGAGVGILVYLIRTWGNYPDAVAFAVLLMNMAAPLIDQYIRPKAYGYNKR